MLEQRDRRRRVVELGEVVRDVGDEAHRVVAPLPQPHLEQGLGAGRDPQLAAPPALPGQQLGVVGVLGDRDRPGVRHRHRHRAHATRPGRRRTAPRPSGRRGRRPPSGCRAPDRGAAGTACRRCRGRAGRPAGAARSRRSGRARTTSVAAARGSRGAGRRRRWRRPGCRRGRRGAGRRGPPRCRRRGSRRGPAPSAAARAPRARARRRRCGPGSARSRQFLKHVRDPTMQSCSDDSSPRLVGGGARGHACCWSRPRRPTPGRRGSSGRSAGSTRCTAAPAPPTGWSGPGPGRP